MWNSLSNISFYENLLNRNESENVPITVKDVNIKKMCRTCLRDAPDEDNLFKDFELGAMNINMDGNILKIIDMLRESTGLQVEEDDILPHQICNNCIQNISGAYFFGLQCYKAESTLVKLIAAISGNNDDDYDDYDDNNEDKYENIQHLDDIISINGKDEKFEFISLNDSSTGNDSDAEDENHNNDDDDNADVDENNDNDDDDDVVVAAAAAPPPTDEEKSKLMEIDLIDSVVNTTCVDLIKTASEVFDDYGKLEVHIIEFFDKFERDYNGDDDDDDDDNDDDGENNQENIDIIDKNNDVDYDDITMATISSNTPHRSSSPANSIPIEIIDSINDDEEIDEQQQQQQQQSQEEFVIVENEQILNNNDNNNDNIENIISNKNKSIKQQNAYIKCTECDEEFKLKKTLHEHIKIHHPNVKAFKCDICNAKFGKLQILKRHVKIHQDDQKNKLCTFCGKRFARADDLKRHIRTHTNERPYSCNICQKSYKQTSELKEHLVTHYREKIYNCEICGKSLLTRNGYYVHMKVHAGVKNHECHFCGNKYVTTGELNSHIRHIHEKERPYECKFDNCNRKFVTKLSFEIHQRSHTGERPFQCSICDKKLATSSSLSDHIKIHSGQKRFHCKLCLKTFNSSTSYKKHISIHDDKMRKEKFKNTDENNKLYNALMEADERHQRAIDNKLQQVVAKIIANDSTVVDINDGNDDNEESSQLRRFLNNCKDKINTETRNGSQRTTGANRILNVKIEKDLLRY